MPRLIHIVCNSNVCAVTKYDMKCLNWAGTGNILPASAPNRADGAGIGVVLGQLRHVHRELGKCIYETGLLK